MPALQQSGIPDRPIPAAPADAAQQELRPPKELPPPNPSIPSISSIRWLGGRRKILTARNDDIGLDFHPDYLEGPWVIRRGFLCIDPFDFAADGSIRCNGPTITEQTLPALTR